MQDIQTDRDDFNTILALGANIRTPAGSPLQSVRAAIKYLTPIGFTVGAVSRMYATPAHPPGAGPEFVNAAVLVAGGFPPEEALERLHRVEAAFGRERVPGRRWRPRPLDIDLIAVGERVLPDAATQGAWRALPPARQMREAPGELILPHPRLQDRAFVLVPMADVAPGWRHPLTGDTVEEMLARLPEADRAAVRPLE